MNNFDNTKIQTNFE